ncbi:MAG: SDR family NAD(P)-dependent oxidoreductase [Candidatus Dormibacteraeota bacterium]|nr:SDR family NAD(P)-dependent oxidoreductase [Candidatus Dormibacteraeota bacterium]
MTQLRGATLVTGGAGFIGSHLVDLLLARDEQVVVLDDFNDFYEPAWKWRNLGCARGRRGFHLLRGDVRDPEAVMAALRAAGEPVRRVVHLAARAGIQPSLVDPTLYADVNVTGTAVVLEACRKAEVEGVVVASSSSVYGADRGTPFTEEEPADCPVSPYAATKRANELQCWTFHHLTGIPVSCLRFFTAYGPRNRPDMAVYKFGRAISAGAEIVMYGEGVERDFTYVGDVVAGVAAAWERDNGYLLCNLGSGRPVPVAGLIQGLEKVLGRRGRVSRAPLPPGDVPITWASTERARRALGWTPGTSLEEGLARFAEWYAETGVTAA